MIQTTGKKRWKILNSNNVLTKMLPKGYSDTPTNINVDCKDIASTQTWRGFILELLPSRGKTYGHQGFNAAGAKEASHQLAAKDQWSISAGRLRVNPMLQWNSLSIFLWFFSPFPSRCLQQSRLDRDNLTCGWFFILFLLLVSLAIASTV